MYMKIHIRVYFCQCLALYFLREHGLIKEKVAEL